MLLVHLFVYFACTDFCPFSLPLGVSGWLHFVTVALPQFSISFVCHNIWPYVNLS